MLVIIGLLILAVLLFGASRVLGAFGVILGAIAFIAALSLFFMWVGPYLAPIGPPIIDFIDRNGLVPLIVCLFGVAFVLAVIAEAKKPPKK